MGTELSFPDRIRRISMLLWLVIPSLAVFFTVQFFQTQVLSSEIQDTVAQTASITPTPLAQITAEFQVPAEVPTWEIYQGKPMGLVSFWFDGGWSTEYDLAYPVLNNYEYPATIAVTTSALDTNPGLITTVQLQELQTHKWEISSFTQTANCEQFAANVDTYKAEVSESKKDLMRKGLAGNQLSVPCGEFPSALAEVQQKYDGQKTSETGLNQLPITDKYALKSYHLTEETTYTEVSRWLREAKQEKKWLILSIKQVADNPTKESISPEKFARIVAMVNQQKLPVVTPSQVLPITEWRNQ